MGGLERRLAQDAAAKRYDRDGRLHVDGARLTKACTSDYLGSEIPDAAALGLTPGKLYQLFRDGAELRKAVPTFVGCPILSTHKPVTAAEPAPSLVVGSVLSAEWAAPFVIGDLVIWDAAAISAIETGRKSELSAGYHYRCDLTPGRSGGESYDGVMREISFNHLALVSEGRIGAECALDNSPHVIEAAHALLRPRHEIQRRSI